MKKDAFAILLVLNGLVAVAQDAMPSAMRDVAPGEIRPSGWLREMACAVRDGYTVRMDEVDEEFRRAWGPDFRPRGDKVHWSRRQGSWPSEGGAYWFEALSLLAFQIDDPELKRMASNRIETVIARINPESWGFLWWMDRRNREDVAALKGDPFLLRNSERLTTALCQWYRATGDRRIPEALRVAYAPAAFDLTRPFVGGYEAWQVTRDESLARLLDANVGRLGDDYRVKLYWNAPDAGLAKTLSLKYADERRLKLPTRHGYDVTSSLLIHLRAYQWSGDVRRLEVARKWLDFFGANCRMPFGQIVKDEEWGWPGAYRAVETCTAARENQVYLAYLAALGEGRWGDEVEEAVFNIAVNAMSADCTEHVYLQQPNRLKSDDLGQCSHAGDPDLDGVMVRHGEYRRKHYPLCCTAGLNLFWPNFIQNLWLLPGDGGLAAALYSPCTLDTALGGGRVRVKEETDYPFAETVRFTFEAVPGGRFPLRLRLPRWCAKPQATVNGATVVLTADTGFARIDREWKAGDVVSLTLPMAPRLERMRDMNPTASGGAAVDYGYFKLGPLLLAENLPSAGLNAAPADVRIPSLAADAAAKVVRTGKPLGWKDPAEAPVRLVTRTADGRPLELVPYGSAKFRISMFPIDVPCVDFAGQGVPVKRLNGMCNTIPMKGNRYPDRTNLLERQIRALEIPETRFHDVVYDNAGIQLVDVSRIFPLFRADENDPLNYDFRPTDLYLARARELGGELEFRFGEQIEHQAEQFQVRPPADIGKWARICVNIARHYNDGWANGYRWNIRRFSVWEEPDNDLLLTDAAKGNYEKCYFKMYAAVARGIKSRWPEAQVGGPNCCRAEGLRVNFVVGDSFEKFLRHCVSERLPLDFAAYTIYASATEEFFDQVRKARKLLDDLGFAKTELQISEWHGHAPDLTSIPTVAFQCAVLTQGQVEPIDHMFYYAMHVSTYGIFGPANKPRPAYYGFRDFAEAAHGAVRVPGPVRPAPGWYALATRRDDGSVRLLLTAYGAKDGLRLKVKGAVLKSATTIVEKGEPAPFGGYSFVDGELRLPKPTEDAVYLFRN